MGSVKRAVKKIARPKVILPLAAAAILGPAALTGLKGAALKGAAAKGSLMGSGAVTSALAPNVGIGAALKAAPALAGNFIKTGLMNPFSGPGAAVYGGAGLGLAALMGKPKTDTKPKPTSFADAFRQAKGKKTFEFKGKKYARVTADEVKKAGFASLKDYLNAPRKTQIAKK
jgi:hypothetical protein